MSHRVFVYGSLMRGLHNHQILAGAVFDGPARTLRGYSLYDLGAFPGMVAAGAGVVIGEVYIVDAVTLAALDRLESNGRWYRRSPLRLADDTPAEGYLLRPAQVMEYQALANGDWRRHYEEKFRR